MGNESSKSIFGKLADSRYATRYLVGRGIDIGAGGDPLGQYMPLFPLMTSCDAWDKQNGDAQFMRGVPDNSYDFVHSAHCLEHLEEPQQALCNWVRILKPGGHLVCIVPDEDLYEQGQWPSTFNSDHKWTFSVYKSASWSPKHLDVTQLIKGLPVVTRKIELLDRTFIYGKDRQDQTANPVGECAIEFVLCKD